MKDALGELSHVTFRRIPDEEGDSATFLSFFLPGESEAREAAARLTKAGIDGAFYWYENNWHYFRKWEHLKKLDSAARLPITLLGEKPDYQKLELPQSDNIMKRTISLLIKLSWTEGELSQRIDKMLYALKV
jgi:8-amino-3,8-dideoxy-alpha-D-manno-octulosonate transaminase